MRLEHKDFIGFELFVPVSEVKRRAQQKEGMGEEEAVKAVLQDLYNLGMDVEDNASQQGYRCMVVPGFVQTLKELLDSAESCGANGYVAISDGLGKEICLFKFHHGELDEKMVSLNSL